MHGSGFFVGMGKLWGGMLAVCFAKNLWWQYVFPLLEGGQLTVAQTCRY